VASERIRSATFRWSYWDRMLEMAPLLNADGQRLILQQAAARTLPRRHRKLAQKRCGRPGPLTPEHADSVAKRFALWQVRRQFDWASDPVSRFRADVVTKLWHLDVELRRAVEGALMAECNTADAARLRAAVESTAGSLAVALDLAGMERSVDYEIELAREHFTEMCNQHHELLALLDASARR